MDKVFQAITEQQAKIAAEQAALDADVRLIAVLETMTEDEFRQYCKAIFPDAYESMMETGFVA